MPVSVSNLSNPSQETPHTGDPNPVCENESTHLQDSARQSTSSAFDSVAPVAVAIDFFADGTTSVHKTYTYPRTRDAPPSFQCALLPNSMRVILYETKDVSMEPNWFGPPYECSCYMNPNQDNKMCYGCIFRPIIYPPRASSTESFSDSSHKEPSINDTRRSPCTKKPNQRQGSYGAAWSTSSGASTSFRGPAQRRKTYRSASGLDQTDLHRFWSHGGVLELGTNVILDNISTAEAQIWKKVAGFCRHVLLLGDTRYPVHTLPNCLRIHRRNDNALEVECRFLYTEIWRNRRLCIIGSGLRDKFWDHLNALASAPRLFNNDLQLGILLVTLEFLDAQQLELCNFLYTVCRKLTSQTEGVNINNISAYWAKNHISDYIRSARGLVQATDCTINAIRRISCSDKRLKTKLEHIIAQKRATQLDLRKYVADIKQDADSMFFAAEQYVSRRRDAALKRLTLIASVFLPLTLASSVLSMNNRVRDLGPLWWDWLGICVITGLIIISGYQISSSWDNFKIHLRIESFTQGPQRVLWNRIKTEVLHKASRPGEKRTSLFPRAVNIAWTLSKAGLYLATCASFLLGMFSKNVGEGGRVLGYSIAGTIIFFFSFILFWKLVKAVITISRATTTTTTKKPEDGIYNPPLKLLLFLKGSLYFGGLIYTYDTWDKRHSWVRTGSMIWFGVHCIKLMAFFFDDLIIKMIIRLGYAYVSTYRYASASASTSTLTSVSSSSTDSEPSKSHDYFGRIYDETMLSIWPKGPDAMAKLTDDLERQPTPRASLSRSSLASLGDIRRTSTTIATPPAAVRRASMS